MKILLLLAISPILGWLGFKLSEKTKIPLILLLIVVGIIFGVSGVFNIFGAESIQPAISKYSNMISVPLIFIMAGFNLDLDLIKKNKKATLKLGIIPVYLTLIVITFAALAYFKLANFYSLSATDETFSFVGAFLFAFMCVVSAPVLLVPAALKLKPTEHPVGVTMIAGSILDNYTALPVAFIAIANGYFYAQGSDLTPLMVVGIIVGIIVVIGALGGLGVLVARLTNKILLKTKFMQDFIMNKQLIACTIYAIICIVTVILIGSIPTIGAALKSFTLIYVITFGAGLEVDMSPEQKASIAPNWQKLLLMFGLPVMFLGLGGRTELAVLFNVKVIGFIVTMFIVNRGVKTLITKQVLKSEGFNKEECSAGARLAIFDGASPVNLSIALAPMLAMVGQSDITILTAAYGIALYAITIPLGEKLLSKYYAKPAVSK